MVQKLDEEVLAKGEIKRIKDSISNRVYVKWAIICVESEAQKGIRANLATSRFRGIHAVGKK